MHIPPVLHPTYHKIGLRDANQYHFASRRFMFKVSATGYIPEMTSREKVSAETSKSVA